MSRTDLTIDPRPLWASMRLVAHGAMGMAYQLILVKAITPYYGTSLNTWAITIASFLFAYALGGLIGAKIAVKRSLWRPWIICTAIVFVVVAVLQQVVIRQLAGFPFYVGIVSTVTLLGVVPSTLFTGLLSIHLQAATASPADQSFAFGCVGAGNIVGTLVSVFVMLPYFGLEVTTALAGGIFVLLCAWWCRAVLKERVVLMPLAVVAFASFGFQMQHEGVIFSKYDSFGWIGVAESDGYRIVLHRHGHKNSIESVLNMNCPEAPVGYAKEIFNLVDKQPAPKRILQIGLGAGGINHYVAKHYPETELVSVDINPTMVEVARDYFHIPQLSNHRVVVDDARHFLRADSGRFDWIILDAFLGEYPPEHLRTAEFFSLVADHLNEHGLLLVNFVTYRADHDRDLASIKSAFPYVYQKTVNAAQNVLICGATPLPTVGAASGVSVAYSGSRSFSDNFSIRQSF